MAKITSEALNNPGALQPGAAGSYRAWLIKGANTLANGAGLGPGYFGNADEQAAILSKLGTLAARNLTPEQVMKDVILAAQPTKSFVTYDQLAGLMLYLVSDAGASVNGAILPIDGGWTAQ